MTVAAPPRRPDSPPAPPPGVEPAPEPEALIEEARQRTRRRRRWYAACAVVAGTGIAAVLLGTGAVGGTAGTATTGSSASGMAQPRDGLIAFATAGGLDVIAPDGTGRRRLASCRGSQTCTIAEYAWSPDGTRIAFLRGAPGGPGTGAGAMSLFVARADGSGERRLATCGEPPEPGDCSHGAWRAGPLAWSPDGSRIVFNRGSGVFSRNQGLWLVRADGGGLRRLTTCASCVDAYPAWSPDGTELTFSRISGRMVTLYAIRLAGSGARRPIASGASHAVWSPDGRRLAFDRQDGVYSARPGASGARALVRHRSPGEGPGMPSWSPDGKRLAYFRTPGTRGAYRSEVWLVNADGTGRRRLYAGGCCIVAWAPPVWSPDGDEVAFAQGAERDGRWSGGTLVVSASGGAPRGLTQPLEYIPPLLAWQPPPRG